MKHRLTIGLLITLVLAPAVTTAAEPDAVEPTADQEEQDSAKTPTKPSTSPDIFIPTEEISEDFAVPFPVDI